MDKSTYICIHGHFYQPPRENPWLEEVEIQHSAYPWNNWNERITAECYAPNTAARLLDGRGRIVRVVNNYSRISFNFGPTLLSWLEKYSPEVYESLLEADSAGASFFSGHGPAIAQAYNHMIMPLADKKDKITQVKWGIRDFACRFRREPEGMWLPETAVDLETLEVLADNGIVYTILSPGQAGKVLSSGTFRWSDISRGKIDTGRPYFCNLPSGNRIFIFFYDGQISREIAFGKLLDNGDKMADTLVSAGHYGSEPVLVSVATDGETYGHHHKYGDMALAYALEKLEKMPEVKLTVYGEFLEKFPASDEIEIIENTSWSCAHGISRWKEDCGCSTGYHPSWQQEWRNPLRESLNWLRDRLKKLYTEILDECVDDPWGARNNYIELVLERTPGKVEQFLERHFVRGKRDRDRSVKVMKALEMQHRAMLMFTSCGWFFDDLSGIETVQILRYACQAMQYAYETKGLDLEKEFLSRLEKGWSNFVESGNGRDIYLSGVKPVSVDFKKLAAYFGVMSLFSKKMEDIPSYCFGLNVLRMVSLGENNPVARFGRIAICSKLTMEEKTFSFSSISIGGHNVLCSVSKEVSEQDFRAMEESLKRTFEHGDMTSMINIAESYLGDHSYNLEHIFRREQQYIVDRLLRNDLEKIHNFLGEILEKDQLFMNFIASVRMPVPEGFKKSAEMVLNASLQRELREPVPDIENIKTAMDKALRWNVNLDRASLSSSILQWLDSRMAELSQDPWNLQRLSLVRDLLALFRDTIKEANPWYSQNIFLEVARDVCSGRFFEENTGKTEWENVFRETGELLGINTEFCDPD